MSLNNCVDKRHRREMKRPPPEVDPLVEYTNSGGTQLTHDKDHEQNMLERVWRDHETPSVLGVHSFNKY